MQVSDVMTRSVLAVDEDTPVDRVVQLLIDHGISAVPVTRHGELVGLISESDLLTAGRRSSMNREAWFKLLIHGHGRHHLPKIEGLTARAVMSSPVISVNEHTDITEAVQLMIAHRIKRLPVTHAGKLVGIVARADMLHALTRLPNGPGAVNGAETSGLFEGIDRDFARNGAPHPAAAPTPPQPPVTTLTADEFRHAVEAAKEHVVEERRAAKREALERHLHDIEAARDAHVSESNWRTVLLNARHAAERGDTELQVLRFPREVCSDAGRAVDNAEEGWETTLHGEAADIFRRWATELKPAGFHLRARTVEYPNGFPGDIGLFLSW